MTAFLDLIAHWLQAFLPGFVRLPSLTFEMPHTIYWAGLVLFPLLAMYLVKRDTGGGERARVSTPLAWVLWLSGGFVGLHRFYLRANWLGFVYIVLFIAVLHGNAQTAANRDILSLANNDQIGAEFKMEHFGKLADEGNEAAVTKLEAAKRAYAAAREALATATVDFASWQAFSGGFALIILILLLVDAARLGHLVRRCILIEANEPPLPDIRIMTRGSLSDPRRSISTPVTDLIDRINGWVGHFIAYWSVIAVFVYYYEVLARYVFNSPTNWAHESMFLLFGMQYLLAGGFALREDSHVRVDVVYSYLSENARAITDLITSFFFFVFTVALLVTGMIFAMDSVEVWEVSFTEWAIQYWPVKISIAVGALLLILQGLSKVIRDTLYLAGRRA
jgi:TRAP-type mannitol/chloroaromatic compound transport system permease small subunit